MRLGRFILHRLLALTLFVIGIAWIPAAWNSRLAVRWLHGDSTLQTQLANGVAHWIDDGLNRGNFTTGSEQFDGEWLYGTYFMAAMGFGQCALEHPSERKHYLALMERAIDALLTPHVRQFDQERWKSDPLESLDGNEGHAAYLGYMNLAMSFHHLLDENSRFSMLNDRISLALRRRIAASPSLLLESYPYETYPVDNCAVIASVALNSRVNGRLQDDLERQWIKRCRERYIDPQSGLLFQSIDNRTGKPCGAPRGSGTTLGLYLLSFMDMPLSRQLYQAAKNQLAVSIFGFGFLREYPAGMRGTGDIDSGPLIFGLSISATGFAIGGSRIHEDAPLFTTLYTTAHAAGAPARIKDSFHFVTGASLGDSILFAMLTAPPNGIEGLTR